MHIAHYLAIKSAIAACFARANHDKMWAQMNLAPLKYCYISFLKTSQVVSRVISNSNDSSESRY